MKIDLDVGWIDATITTMHLEGTVNFTEDEEKDFKNLLKAELNDDKLTVEEWKRLDLYKDRVLNNSCPVIDDYEINEMGDYSWGDLFEE